MSTPVTIPPVSDVDFPAFLDRALYVGVDDQLLLQAISNVATQVVTVSYRLLRDDGQVVPGLFTYTTGSAVTLLTKAFQLAQGYLIAFEITAPAVGTAGQWLYAKMGLTRGGGATPASYHPLFAGYVGSSFGFGYPNKHFEKPTDGQGVVRDFTISNPAAGSDFTVTVPSNVVWRVQGLFATLTASALPATRQVSFKLANSVSAVFFETPLVAAVTAGQVVKFSVAPGLDVLIDATPSQPNLDLPNPCFMVAGDTLNSVTTAIDGGDQWSTVLVRVREWAAYL